MTCPGYVKRHCGTFCGLGEHISVTEADLYSVLTEIISDTLDVDDLVLTPDTTAADVPGWDSLKMVSIIIAVEARFRVRIRSSEIDTLKTVGDLAGVIRTKVA